MSDTATEALPVEEGRLLAFVPAELIIDDKTRRDIEATITPAWVAGLRAHAATARPYPSDTGEMHPCGNHSAAEQLAALVDAWSENHDREQTTAADDAVLIEALSEIPGVTEAKAAKALGIDRRQVKALRTIAKSPAAAHAAALGVDIIQSAAIDEFTDDPAAIDTARLPFLPDGPLVTGGGEDGPGGGEGGEDGQGEDKPKKRGGRRVAVECACEPPRRLHMTPKQIEDGPVICGLCHEPFELPGEEAEGDG